MKRRVSLRKHAASALSSNKNKNCERCDDEVRQSDDEDEVSWTKRQAWLSQAIVNPFIHRPPILVAYHEKRLARSSYSILARFNP